MKLQQRYRQATREARWALGLTLLFVIGWADPPPTALLF